MKPLFFSTVKTLSVFTIVCLVQAFSNKSSGSDYYKVFLNGKLITEHYLTQPVAIRTFYLTAANQSDKLTVLYNHCGATGTARIVSLKDENGKTMKNWKFKDSKDFNMHLAVKEILDASQQANTAFLYYTSLELPSGKHLITLNLPKSVTVKR